jgi:hypothetical protein
MKESEIRCFVGSSTAVDKLDPCELFWPTGDVPFHPAFFRSMK